MESIVYTCITRNYDLLKPPAVVDPNFKYVCFTDNQQKSEVWECRPLVRKFSNPTLTARYHKIQAWKHIDAENYVWQDGNAEILPKMGEFLKTFNRPKHDMKFFRHPSRNCIFAEAKAIIQLKKDHEAVVNKQIEEYKLHPKNYGLFATYIFYYNRQLLHVLDRWWKILEPRSIRDQLSLPIAIHESGLDIKQFFSNLHFHNKYTKLRKHTNPAQRFLF